MDEATQARLLADARQKVKDGRQAVDALGRLVEVKGRAFYQAVILAYGDLDNEYVRECRDDLMKVTTEVREAIATDAARTEMIELLLDRIGDA
jgi:hypothetical protein